MDLSVFLTSWIPLYWSNTPILEYWNMCLLFYTNLAFNNFLLSCHSILPAFSLLKEFFSKMKDNPFDKTFTQRNCFSSVKANVRNNENKIQNAISKTYLKFALLTFSTIIELMGKHNLSQKCHWRHVEDDGLLIDTADKEKLVKYDVTVYIRISIYPMLRK